MIPDIAGDFPIELPWLAEKGQFSSQMLFGVVNTVYFLGQGYLHRWINFQSRNHLCSIVVLMFILTTFNMFTSLSDNLVLISTTALLYALSLVANCFKWTTRSNDDGVGSQVLSKSAPYVSKALMQGTTMLIAHNKGIVPDKSKDLSYFWCVVSCILVCIILVLRFTSTKQISEEEESEPKEGVKEKEKTWVDWKFLCVIFVCFQFFEQTGDYLPDQLVKKKFGAFFYDYNIFPLTLVPVWIYLCVWANKYKNKLHSFWVFMCIEFLSTVVLVIKLWWVYYMLLTETEPVRKDWRPMAIWFAERVLNECLCNIAIQQLVSDFCNNIGKPNSLNSKLVIMNQVPFLVLPGMFDIKELIKNPEQQRNYHLWLTALTFVFGVCGVSWLHKFVEQSEADKQSDEDKAGKAN